MKLITMLLILSFQAIGVYGEDNRHDYYQLESPEIKKLSQAVAYQIERHTELKGFKLLKNWTIITRPFYNQNICSEQAYSNQPSMRTNCTGVLVAPNQLLTAGNCITEHYCYNDLYYWMFDYNIKSEHTFSNKRPKKNFYTCKRIIKRVYDPKSAQSYTLLELDRKVKNITPVKISSNINLSLEDELIVMGHIKGLPLKIADDAQVKDMNERLFILNSDISGSSLGSPVFNSTTLELEAIMIYGSPHYNYTSRGCHQVNQLPHNEAKELALKVGFIKQLLK